MTAATLPFTLLELHQLRNALRDDRRNKGLSSWPLHKVLGRIESAIVHLDPNDEFHYPPALEGSVAA